MSNTIQQGTVDIIVPVYNGERFIAQAIESALAQTYKNYQIIIINDGSSDGSKTIIEGYLNRPSVRYFERANGGVAAARNTGIKLSNGEFIAFLDQDDLWLPNKLERQMAYFRQHPDTMLLHANIEYIDDRGLAIDRSLSPWETNISGHCFPELFMENRIAVQTLCMKRECFNAVGPMCEDLAGVDDFEYCLRVARLYRIDHQDEILAKYRLHDANESLKWHLQYIRRCRAMESLLERYPDSYDVIGRKTVNRLMGGLYSEIAWEFYRRYSHAESQAYFKKSIRALPGSFDNFYGLILTAIPPKFRRDFVWYRSRIAKLLTGEAVS